MRMSLTRVGETELLVKIDQAPMNYIRIVGQQMIAAIDLLYNRVREKLSGEVLQVRSGTLLASIQKEVIIGEDIVIGRVFSDGSAPYAGIQEHGGTTKPHDIIPTQAKALRFMLVSGGLEGDATFAKIVHHPGSKIPARSYMASSLSETLSIIRELFSVNEAKLL